MAELRPVDNGSAIYHLQKIVGMEHIRTGEIGEQHTECDRHQQQRLESLYNSQVQQNAGDGYHYETFWIGCEICEPGCIYKVRKYICKSHLRSPFLSLFCP